MLLGLLVPAPGGWGIWGAAPTEGTNGFTDPGAAGVGPAPEHCSVAWPPCAPAASWQLANTGAGQVWLPPPVWDGPSFDASQVGGV